jgi:hypothetical protein
VPCRLAVVGKSDGARRHQRVEIDRAIAAALFTYCGNRANSNQRITPGTARQFFECNDGVERRIRIRHAKYCREPASRRRGSPGSNRLLPFLTRFAQVDVDVDQPGRHDQPCHVDDSLCRIGI